MQSKLLVKMENSDKCLENVMATIRQSEFQVRNLSARLSLDETLFFLTVEVEGKTPTNMLADRITSMNEVRAVERVSA
ncbi:MAG: ACT domain-containing protein [Bdellovibrionota bacterium]